MKLIDRFQHAWNAFTGGQTQQQLRSDFGTGSSSPGYKTVRRYSDSSFASAIFNRIALDASMTSIQHVKINKKNEDVTPVDSTLHNCLNVEANIDQTSIAFMHDLVYSMFDEGCVAVVPVDTDIDPSITGGYAIETLRVGRITQWYPKHVTVKLYNEATNNAEEVTVLKKTTAIIENPLYAVTNGPNATLSRLLRKMALLDANDEEAASGRLDMFIQLPYAVKSDLQKAQAEERIQRIEDQLKKGKRGISYTDATEKIHQLNRPVVSTLLDDIQELNRQFYNQLGLTENVINGTASESEMRTYYTRTIDPIIENIIAEFRRKFLTKTARSQGHTLQAYRDPFKLVPVEQIIELGDTFRRNEIASSNEVRKLVGFKPSSEPRADMLYNPNIADTKQAQPESPGSLTPPDSSSSQNQNG